MITSNNKTKLSLFALVGIYAFIASYPGSFTTSHSYAQQQADCKTNNDAKVISWTGNCVNGLLDGDGELLFEVEYEGKTASIKRVGKFYRGDKTGVYFEKTLTPVKGLYWSILQVSNDDKNIATGSATTPDYDMLTYNWYDKHYDPDVKMTFDEAFAKTVAQAKKANLKSIDPYTLKEYLSGRFKFTKADLQPSTGNSELSDNTNGTDDPKVFGGGSSASSSKKSK